MWIRKKCGLVILCWLTLCLNPLINTVMAKQKSQMTDTVIYQCGKLVTEKTEAKGWLHFLYNSAIGRFFRFFARTRLVGNLYAKYQDSFLSKRKIKKFIRRYDINMDEFVVPPGGYKSFNDFFVRRLKLGARKIEKSPGALIAPADSKLLVFPELTQETCFFVKSKPFCLSSFFKNDEDLAKKYERGTLLLFRLAPYDYHRYHFPCACVPSQATILLGRYESVNPLVYKLGLQPLHENERHVTILKNTDFGDIAMVAVGAMLVGRIIETYTPEQHYLKGDEMGYFAFGGSTLALLFEKGRIYIDDVLKQHSREQIETVVKMGEAVAWKSTHH